MDLRRAPTMADVAERAGVSHQTVSRVVNGVAGVRPGTAERVHRAIEDLGYRRNLAARLLASHRTRTIGVLTWGTGQYGPNQVLQALQAEADRAGYRLSIATIPAIDDAAIRAAIDLLLEQSPEAVVVIVPHETVLRITADVVIDVPTLIVEGDLSRTPLTAAIDNVAGARAATEHLLGLGHRTVVHLAGPPGWAEASARVEGWRAALHDAGIVPPPLRWGGDWSAESGYRAGLALAREDDVTAVFAANDQMALGLLAALRAAGRRVPADVSIVGFDDTPESAYFSPPLTTVRQDFATLGRRVIELVDRVLRGEGRPAAPLVETTLVVRQSTAPPSA